MPAPLRYLLGMAVGLLSVYLIVANLLYTLDIVGLADVRVLEVTDMPVVALAVAGSVVAATWAWRRPLPAATLPKVERIAEILTRCCLGFVLPIYGATKLLQVQFRLPFAALDVPLGQATGMALTWRFSGYSYAYTLFLGLAEFVGAGLLFFRRTTTLGACMLLPVLTNVAFLNYSHNIPVKLYSTCYLILSCYLIGLDFPRLSALFLENKAFGPRPAPPRVLSPQTRAGLAVVQVGGFLLATAHAFAFVLLADSVPTALSGSWAVARVNAIDPPDEKALPWTKVFFEREVRGVAVGSVKHADSPAAKRFRYTVGPEERLLTLTFNDPASGSSFVGSYSFIDERTLEMTGRLGERRVKIRLARQY
ncbi:MAG: hypothetical protein U0746_11010 [Gemmataceae bacterium]